MPWVSAHLEWPWRSHRGLLPGLGPQDTAGVRQEGAVGLMGQKPWQQEGGLAVLTWSLMTSAHGVLGGPMTRTPGTPHMTPPRPG